MRLPALIASHALAVAGVEAVFSLSPLVLARAGAAGAGQQAAWAGLAAAAGVGASMAAAPLWARLADAGYRRGMLARAYAGMALAAIAALLAAGPWQFVAARVLLGLLGGGTLAASSLVAAGPAGAAAVSRVQAASLWGAALGPVVGGWLLASGRIWVIGLWATLGAVAAAAAAAAATLRLRVDETPAPQEDEPAASASSFGLRAGLASAGRSLEDPWIPLLAGGDAALAGAALSVSRTAAALAAPAWGAAASRRGPRRVLIAALAAAGALTAAQALPLGAGAFLSVRALLGAAAGGLSALLMADAVVLLGERRRGAACAAVAVGADAGKAAAGLAAAALPGATAAVALGGAVLLVLPRFLVSQNRWRSSCDVSSLTPTSTPVESPAA
ncbi:MAG: MFS transporter [Elusimicrobiota bacterium]|nr:MFS transporter [Elusimicrobiota bacterium]